MLAAGTHLGPYEVLHKLGEGGMGEVYRGRDTRLGRDVAIKVLLASFAADPDRLRRFEAEARAAGRLNHPNILAIYDIGSHDASPYLVSELLEGETLRERLAAAPVPVPKAIDFAVQIAQGLSAAHEKGITHRDLKPENLFITRDERVKILDFGLAKARDAEADASSVTIAASHAVTTEPGILMGSVGYMFAEQIRGQPIDHRSDIFSLGVVLCEMLTGTRPFRGDSTIETLNAVLKDEPAELSQPGRPIPAGLERVVRRCIEKKPDARWQTTRDLAFALESVSMAGPIVTASLQTTGSTKTTGTAGTTRRRVVTGLAVTAVAVAVAAAVATAYLAGRRTSASQPLTLQRLTFARGTIWSARFAPDGRTIAYSASWDGKAVDVFSTRPDGPESRSLGIPDADVLAVSPSGEMALLLKPGSVFDWGWKLGTLARASLGGGAPRESLRGVQLADWSADGQSLAVVRASATGSRLEFPAGTTRLDTPNLIGALRVSRTGRTIAFAERSRGLGSNWAVRMLDVGNASGSAITISTGWAGDYIDLAWSPAGDEIWFDTRQGGDDSLHAVTLTGRHRLLTRLAAPLQLFDVSTDGRALLGRGYWRSGIIGVPPDAPIEQDLSWLDASEIDDISFNGKAMLFTEFGEGGGAGRWSVYFRRFDDRSAAVRLGDGQGFALSPDGTRALALRRALPPQLVLWPTGAGEPVLLKNENIVDYAWADWLPDGKAILFSGAEAGHGSRCYVQNIDGGRPRAVTPEGTTLAIGQRAVSPDGEWAVAMGQDGRAALYPLAGGPHRAIPGIQPGDVPIRWSADERLLFVFRRTGATPSVFTIDLATGRNALWREILPPDPAGIVNVWGLHVGPDERAYYYSYMRNLSDLYLVHGIK